MIEAASSAAVCASPSGALAIFYVGWIVKTFCWTAVSLILFLTATLVAGCGSIIKNSTAAQASSGSGSGSGSSGSGSGSGGSGSGSGGSGSGSGGSGSGGSGSGGSGSGGSGSSSGGALALVPADAVRVDAIQSLSNWNAVYDTGTSGSSGNTSGATKIVEDPSLSGEAREFSTEYSNYGGERYDVSFGKDTAATHFLYDVWVYLDSSVSSVANLELDMNQVTANGKTVIYGFQCDGWSGTWDYTTNAGTPEIPVDKWVHSDQACDVQTWSQNTWHHVQVAYSRDDAGNVTYQSVWLDDVKQDINATTPSAFALGWGSTLLTNLQVDGRSASGSSSVYLDNLTIYRW